MQNIQEVFDRVQGTKQERRSIQTQYKDSLDSSQEYKDIVEKIRGFKLRKKQIEDEVKTELGEQYEKFMTLKRDMDMDKELLTDLAISTLMKGDTVKVKDSNENFYDPVFKVSFKRTNEVDQRRE